ncbi:hypothetical protein GGS20DRAFT_591347 [Poronia punctata]|nr:hypothetical protein GGS20DRAFT_591347 [Poronia punctata]
MDGRGDMALARELQAEFSRSQGSKQRSRRPASRNNGNQIPPWAPPPRLPPTGRQVQATAQVGGGHLLGGYYTSTKGHTTQGGIQPQHMGSSTSRPPMNQARPEPPLLTRAQDPTVTQSKDTGLSASGPPKKLARPEPLILARSHDRTVTQQTQPPGDIHYVKQDDIKNSVVHDPPTTKAQPTVPIPSKPRGLADSMWNPARHQSLEEPTPVMPEPAKATEKKVTSGLAKRTGLSASRWAY